MKEEQINKGLKIKNLIIVILISLVLPLILWTVGYIRTETNFNIFNYFVDIPSFINNVSTFFAAIIGLEIVKSGVFTKGTPWYPQKYGERKLKKVLDKQIDMKLKSEYIDLRNQIEKLNKAEEDFNNQYFQYVYILLETSVDFKMVWNDFNYYSSIKTPKKEEIVYLNRLRFYVYQEIINLDAELKMK